MRITQICPRPDKGDDRSRSRSGTADGLKTPVKRSGRVVDMVDLSHGCTEDNAYPSWLETYIRLLPQEAVAERVRQAFGNNDGVIEKILMELL